ncbi:MAG: hypothetical protein ABSE49_16060 [Polyangiaceae bacterium]|jgi:hypothetical protein
MRLPLLLAALLVAACGGSTPPATGPCGPCPSTGGVGLQGITPPQSTKLAELRLKRVELAQKRVVLLRASFDKGKTSIDELFAACRDVAFAARDSGVHGGALRDILREYRDGVVALRDLTRERAAKGAVGEDEVSRIEGIVAEAEFWLEEASEGP